MKSTYIVVFLFHNTLEQDKVYCDELRKIFVDDDREITVDDLEKMPYMEQIIKEALRHLNLISYVFRRAERELKISKLDLIFMKLYFIYTVKILFFLF